MSSLDLIKFVADENHVKFRSTLSEILYSRLAESIGEKTKDMVADIFGTERLEEEVDLADYVATVIEEAEKQLGAEFTAEEIEESTNHILSLLEKEEKEEDEDEEEKDEEEKDEEEEEEEEEEDEDKPAEDAEKKASEGKGGTVVHVDTEGAHKTIVNKNGKGDKK